MRQIPLRVVAFGLFLGASSASSNAYSQSSAIIGPARVEDPSTAVVVLQQKMAFLTNTETVSMAWRTSSVVFVATIIGALWIKREKIRELPASQRHWLARSVLGFIGFVIAFGVTVIVFLTRWHETLQPELAILRIRSDVFDLEIESFRIAMALGTSNFVLMGHTEGSVCP